MEETEEGGFGLYATWISNADGKELGFSRPGNDGYKMLFLHNTFIQTLEERNRSYR